MSQIVKKGLASCASKCGKCRTCPYCDNIGMKCIRKLSSDALAYIETLEARLAQDAFDRMLEMKG